MALPDGTCLLRCSVDGVCHQLCHGANSPCKAASPHRGRQQVRAAAGLKSQLDNFMTINIICGYAGHGYDTNN